MCKDNNLNEKSLQKAIKIYNQLKSYLKKFNLKQSNSLDDVEAIERCIVSVYLEANGVKIEDVMEELNKRKK